LAKAAGIAPTSLQAYFHNSEPSRTVIVRLALAGNVSVSWLASGHRPRSPDGLPEGYFAVPSIDFRASGGRIYPLLGQPTEFRIFRNSDFEKPADGDLMAVQMPEGCYLYISDSDTLVIDRRDQPSIGSGPPAALVLPLREDGIYAVAQQARVLLRQLRWDKVGESPYAKNRVRANAICAGAQRSSSARVCASPTAQLGAMPPAACANIAAASAVSQPIRAQSPDASSTSAGFSMLG
jgi:hypothetical protein